MFIPIESVNLYLYIAYKNLIFPFKYRPNSNPSIQDRFPEYILLSENRWVEGCNVSIEIALDRKKYKPVSIGNGFYLLNNVIPITKIKKIWFRDRKQMETTIGNIELFSAFVPKHWLAVDNDITEYRLQTTEKHPNLPHRDFSKDIKLFDKYLGSLTLLKHHVGEEVNSVLKFFGGGVADNILLDFLKGENRLKKTILERDITLQDIKQLSNQSIKTIAGIVDIQSIDKNSETYIWAVLYQYRRKLKDNLDGLLNQIEVFKTQNFNRYKGILFSYGLMSGYSQLARETFYNGQYVLNKFKFDKKDIEIIDKVYKYVFGKYFDTKEKIISTIQEMDIFNISISELMDRFGVSKRTAREYLKLAILRKKIHFSEKVKLLKKFNMRIGKSLKIERLEQLIKVAKSLSEIADELQLSEKSVKQMIRSITNDIRIFQRFRIRPPKKLRVQRLQEILQSGKELNKKRIAKQLGIGIATLNRYLRELGEVRNIA